MAKGSDIMKPKKTCPWLLFWFLFSLIFIIIGFVLPFIWPFLLNYIIETNMVLVPHSHTYDLWKKFPDTLPIKFYFFNWTNPNDIYNETIKPKFVEVGPYHFLETKEKSDINWNDNGTVTFKHLRYWFFDEFHIGNGNIEDKITTVNPVALSAVHTSRLWSPLMRKGLSLSLLTMASTVHLARTVKQMLFEGYSDPLINVARTLPLISGTVPPWDKFGWFYMRNGSRDYEGIFNMGTGKKTVFGQLYSWNYLTKTPFYSGGCGQINGSAGEFFPVNPGKHSISLFSSDLCRSLTLNYVGENNVGNILGYKYVLDTHTLDNGTIYPENACFCNGECVPSGLLNVSSCRFGSPSFASLPHFYNADPYYNNLIEGLQPNRKKHEFAITLEPVTGIPLEVNARLQINLLLQPIESVSTYEKVPRIFFPVLWFEQSVKIPSDEAIKLKLLLNMPVICSSIGISMIFVGLIMLSCVFYKICTMKLCERPQNKYLYEEQQVPLKTEYHREKKI